MRWVLVGLEDGMGKGRGYKMMIAWQNREDVKEEEKEKNPDDENLTGCLRDPSKKKEREKGRFFAF